MNGPFLRFVMSHPPHIFLAPLVGIFQYFKDVRFLVESLALYQIVRDNTKCAVFLNVRLLTLRILDSSSSVRKRSPWNTDLGVSSIAAINRSILSSP